jgi:hypothetical protein
MLFRPQSKGTHPPRDALSKGRVGQGKHRLRDALFKGRIVQGTVHPTFFVQGLISRGRFITSYSLCKDDFAFVSYLLYGRQASHNRPSTERNPEPVFVNV